MNLNKAVLKFVKISFSILVLLLIVLALMKLGTICYDFGYKVFAEETMEEAPGTDVSVRVTEDLSDMQIGQLLEDSGLIEDKLLFAVQAKIYQYDGKLRPGLYTLNTSMAAVEMMDVMSAEPETETVTSTEAVYTPEEDTQMETEEPTEGDVAE